MCYQQARTRTRTCSSNVSRRITIPSCNETSTPESTKSTFQDKYHFFPRKMLFYVLVFDMYPSFLKQKLTYLGTAINSFTSLEMVVISRYVRWQFFARPIGGNFEPTDDKNVLLRIPKDCFPYNTNIYFKVK